jgi:hypothetical protein
LGLPTTATRGRGEITFLLSSIRGPFQSLYFYKDILHRRTIQGVQVLCQSKAERKMSPLARRG